MEGDLFIYAHCEMLQDLMPGVGYSLPDSISVPDVKIDVENLKNMSAQDFIDTLVHRIVGFAIDLAVAILVFYLGRFIIGKIVNVVSTIMIKRKVDKSLSTFVISLIKMVLYFLLIVTVIGILGIETSSFIALFASAGVAIGMALSGTLQNFAGGVLILLIKPYKVGDYIEAQGYAGTVKEIQIFHTIITTPDNKSIIIPNGGLSTGSVNNYSREEYRRVDWIVSISYGDDVDVARAAILDIIHSNDSIVKQYIEDDRKERLVSEHENEPEELDDTSNRSWLYRLFHKPKEKVKEKLDDWQTSSEVKILQMLPKVDRSPVVLVDTLASSSVDLKVRAWTRNVDYWNVYFSINEQIYKELPNHGINFPFPQLDVHLPKNQ